MVWLPEPVQVRTPEALAAGEVSVIRWLLPAPLLSIVICFSLFLF